MEKALRNKFEARGNLFPLPKENTMNEEEITILQQKDQQSEQSIGLRKAEKEAIVISSSSSGSFSPGLASNSPHSHIQMPYSSTRPSPSTPARVALLPFAAFSTWFPMSLCLSPTPPTS